MHPDDESLAALALTLVPRVGPVRWRQLMASAGSAHAALERYADTIDIAATLDAARVLRAQCDARSIRIELAHSPTYPERLHALGDSPNPVYALGDLGILQGRRTVALVGSRHASPAGRGIAFRLAAALAAEDVVVVSGLAAGIDAESHAGTLATGGRTVAVLGTGVDVPYPVFNAALHANIVRQGLVLSERAPGTGAFAGAFPRRNRIIAALAEVVVVVEAGARSGALITAQQADALGRLIAAVPGSIDGDFCVGSNQLLRDGAHVVTSADDILAMLSLVSRPDVAKRTIPDGSQVHQKRGLRAVTHMRKNRESEAHAFSMGRRASRRSPSLGAPVLDSGERGRRVETAPRAGANHSPRRGNTPDDSAYAEPSAWAGVIPPNAAPDAPSTERRILEILAAGPQFTDELIRSARAGAREVGSALSLLMLTGLVEIDVSGLVRRR